MIGLCDDIVAFRDQPGNKRRTELTGYMFCLPLSADGCARSSAAAEVWLWRAQG